MDTLGYVILQLWTEALNDENFETTKQMYKNLNMMALNRQPGSMDPEELKNKVIRSIEDHQIQHVVIDNLQYLLFGGKKTTFF